MYAGLARYRGTDGMFGTQLRPESEMMYAGNNPHEIHQYVYLVEDEENDS